MPMDQAPQQAQQGQPQEQQGGKGGPSDEELINGTAAALTAVAQRLQQAGAPKEIMSKMVGLMNEFGQVAQMMQGGQPQQQRAPEGQMSPQNAGPNGVPMSPAGV